MPTKIPTRWLKTPPMVWKLWQSGSLPATTLESFHAEVTEDARSAVELLGHLVSCAGVLDTVIQCEPCPTALRDLAQASRLSFRAWVPPAVPLRRPLADLDLSTRDAGPQEGIEYSWQRRLSEGSTMSPADLQILRAQLVSAIKGQEAAERQLALVRADADHLRVVLETERAEAREDFRLMRGAAGTMREGAAGVRLLGSLLDRARNWVQDPVLRAEITAHCPPKPRTEADQ